jgi:hypothetical protein
LDSLRTPLKVRGFGIVRTSRIWHPRGEDFQDLVSTR